ncbi:MAG TPA: hypothetical protein VK452_04480 [Dissulfurispiraceae bacterium]|nr:hypothetical protein [Dissulfurispiraceae bacterium]
MSTYKESRLLRFGMFSVMALLIIAVPLTLPLRLESSIFIFLVGLSAVFYAFVFLLIRLIKKTSGSAVIFGYRPKTSYMTGKSVRKSRNERASQEGTNNQSAVSVSGDNWSDTGDRCDSGKG